MPKRVSFTTKDGKKVSFTPKSKKTTKRKTPKRKSAPRRKTIKRRSPRKTMAKKRSSPSKKSFASKIPLVNNPTVKKVAQGIGMATIGVTALSLVAPQLAQNPIIRPALAFLGGGVEGVIGQIVVQGGLRGVLGNGGGSNAGFA